MIRFDPSKTEHRIYEIESDIPITNGDHETKQTKSILKPTKDPIPIM